MTQIDPVISPLAKRVPELRTYKDSDDPNDDGDREIRVYFRPFAKGEPTKIVIHTMGSGVASAAGPKGKWRNRPKPAHLAHMLSPGPIWTAEDVAIVVYLNDGMGLGHVGIVFDGDIYAYASEHLALPHCGTSAKERQLLRSEAWRAYVPDEWERQFELHWPGVKSPLDLLDGTSGNPKSLGLETAQLLVRDPHTGMYQTPEQYEATAAYCVDAGDRHGIALPDPTPRGKAYGETPHARNLLTHSWVQPFKRSDRKGGWDPGNDRIDPTYDWQLLLACIAKEKVRRTRVSVTAPPMPDAAAADPVAPPADPCDALPPDDKVGTPARKAVKLTVSLPPDRLSDYALSGYHASATKARAASGPARQAWVDAALAYLAASALAPLGTAWATLVHADRLASIAKGLQA